MQPKLICYKNKRNGKNSLKMQLLKLTTPSVIIQVSFLQILKSFLRKIICIKIKSNTKVQRLTACRIYLKKCMTNVKHNKTTYSYFI